MAHRLCLDHLQKHKTPRHLHGKNIIRSRVGAFSTVSSSPGVQTGHKIYKSFLVLKKNQNAPRPSEHPPVRGGKMSKRLGGIKGCKYKTSSWHLNGFPDGNNIGSTV